ncbi:tyrosine-type recombinase/integrase [Rhodococcus sp. IEGM 1307]|uniref:tyrosine-type recombinase/integrase n=1 Tax=Rhodococcus sp. IEGM 1307 TaxID=3047091 RepID=UPI0032D58FFB
MKGVHSKGAASPRAATRNWPTPTSARTSCATARPCYLYEAGVPLPYIRDILGHVDLATTEIYARASTEAKRKALEATYTEIVTDELPEWNHDTGLPLAMNTSEVITRLLSDSVIQQPNP